MIKLNSEKLRDKIYACWIGKNIGGTMGTPYEGKKELLDIEGFSTPEGTVLPNDDLDLQLIWLKALEERGPDNINPNVLGEYWLNYITPHWNEYGIGKCNMKAGLLPPLSGEYNNYWKNSNGAWIRSEIWACTSPASPDTAIRYALADACVDHGISEGTYAELFTAAIESAAFVVQDALELIDIGLNKIPEDCRVAKSIRIVVDAYKKGIHWKETREMVLKDSLKDIGWFMAPANVAYTMLGLLYGEGDFKKSMILAINCGDDTDCTGATLGALFGIMYGTGIIPEEWKAHIGDKIITVAIDRGSCWGLPDTCSGLTDRVMAIAPSVLRAGRAKVLIHDGQDFFSDDDIKRFKNGNTAMELYSTPPFSNSFDFIFAKAVVDYGKEPVIEPGDSFSLKISFTNRFPDPKQLGLRWILPEGWSVSGGRRQIYLEHDTLRMPQKPSETVVTFTASEDVKPINRIILEVTAPGRPSVGLIPIILLG
jgi:ADP-ribosylglycohydrolase